MKALLSEFIELKQRLGRYSFTINELRSELPISKIALERAIGRYIQKNRIVSVHKGFYVIVPVEYQTMGILPSEQFIDDLMKHLQRPYYIGLLSAAAMHGAAHQRPQESYVITIKPNMRPLKKKGLKVNFVSKSSIPEVALETRNTMTGFLKLSNPVLTAYDLVYYQIRVGGLNRVTEILSELVEVIKPGDMQIISRLNCKIATLQRLGFILEFVLKRTDIADALYKQIHSQIQYRIPLSFHRSKSGYPVDNHWNVIQNISIEAEI